MIRFSRTLTAAYTGITLSEVKDWLMIDTAVTDDDVLLTALIDQVVSLVESYLNTTIGTYDCKLEFWGKDYIELIRQPVIGTISGISVTDPDGDDVDYTEKGYLYTFTTTIDGVINYTVTATTIPDGLKIAIMNIIKNFYNDREKVGLSPEEAQTLNQYRKKIWI